MTTILPTTEIIGGVIRKAVVLPRTSSTGEATNFLLITVASNGRLEKAGANLNYLAKSLDSAGVDYPKHPIGEPVELADLVGIAVELDCERTVGPNDPEKRAQTTYITKDGSVAKHTKSGFRIQEFFILAKGSIDANATNLNHLQKRGVDATVLELAAKNQVDAMREMFSAFSARNFTNNVAKTVEPPVNDNGGDGGDDGEGDEGTETKQDKKTK